MIKYLDFKSVRSRTIVTITVLISAIFEILGSHYSAPFIFTDPDKAGVIYHNWTFISQIILFLGLGISVWKSRLSPFLIYFSILKVGRFFDIYWGNLLEYNFKENFFFFNITAWMLYMVFIWEFEDFKIWHRICVLTHIAFISLYYSIPAITYLFT